MTGPDAGEPPRNPADLARQLRAAADRLVQGWSSAVPVAGSAGPEPPALPTPPATLTARQLQTLLDDVADRRRQIQALREGLGAFDEQLAALETSLAPLLAWTRAWAGVESAVTDVWRPPAPS